MTNQTAKKIFNSDAPINKDSAIINEPGNANVKNVEKLSSHLNAYKVYHEKLGNQLGITVGHYNTSSKEFKKIDKDIIKISGSSNLNLDTNIVEKPSED